MPLSLLNLGNAQISGARVTTLLPGNYETARNVSVIDAPDEGHLTVNPDNSLALVMTGSDYRGPLSFTVEITAANGSTSRQTVNLEVTSPSQAAGWGTGADQYMLETDANDNLVVETGDNHREVYVSASADALTVADIAAREGISRSAVDGEWLAAHPEYGSNPDMALAQDAGAMLWAQLTRADLGAEPGSHWLRFEKGYSYDGFGESHADLFPHGIQGEDELHPIVITSYGQGEQPVIEAFQRAFHDEFANIVVRDLHFTDRIELVGPDGTDSKNIIFDSLTFSEDGEISAQQMDGITLRNSTFANTGEDTPVNGNNWQPSPDRDYGVYSSNSSGVLIENNTFVHIGWGDGYDPNGDGDFPQPPSMFTHNIYMQHSVRDLTFRDNISAEASSYGIQFRSGGFAEDNLFFENNNGLMVRGGDWQGTGPAGNFTLLSGNVVTSAGYKDANSIGSLAMGITNNALDTTLIDNIVAHQTDPNDPGALEDQPSSHGGLNNDFVPFYDDTIVHNWYGSNAVKWGMVDDLQKNTGGLDIDLLNDTTITNLARTLLNDPRADAGDLADWITENDVSADELNAYFQEAFGVLQGTRTSAEEIRFIPNEIGDGVRWDNRINWSTEDLPGTVAGDGVDLGGNWVVYGGNHTIRALGFGDGGQLDISNGRLDVNARTYAEGNGGFVNLSSAGQFWLGTGHIGAATLNVSLDGGRFANTGVITGNVDLFVDDGQALLSADGGDFTLGAGESLVVRGADAQVGFDGYNNQLGVISFDAGSEVVFMSDGTGLGSISEFRSGAYGDAPRVNSHIELSLTDIVVDLSATSGLANGTYTLMSADEITGNIDSFDVIGLSSNRSATLTINHTTDVVELQIENGRGTSVETVGNNSVNQMNGTNIGEELIASASHDLIKGHGGDDIIRSGFGIDIACGHEGNDFINTGADRDLAYGGLGNDTILGGTGQDWLRGGSDDDVINGEQDSDQIEGGWGNDTLTGGAGADVFVFAVDGRDWGDVITDFQVGTDKLVLGDVDNGFRGFKGITLSESNNDAVISYNGNYILLRDVTMAEVEQNVGDIFGTASDLIYDRFADFLV